jgi:tRNA A-37 threonylcarbamoyl transferase component Bud32
VPLTEVYAVAGWHGEVVAHLRPEPLAEEIVRLADPGAAVATIHWGRNYLYAVDLRTAGGPLPVVVKQFRNQGWRKVLERRLRGSKAERSWRAALAMTAAGVATPEPILLVESDLPDGPSYFVSRRVEPALEVRQFFRQLEGREDAGSFPEVEAGPFLEQLGSFCRKLHDSGIWYRDLSMGNVLVRPGKGGELEMLVVDCNRARVGVRLGVVRRSRDICRFPIVERDHRAAFLLGYWGTVPSRLDPRWWLFTASVRGYLLKHALKNRLRAPSLSRFMRRGHHDHIPAAPADAAPRNKAVWDHLSDQPHQHAGRWEKLAIRLADAPEHARDLAMVAGSLPAVWRRYRELRRGLYSTPVPFGGLGICLRPHPADPDALLAAVDELGVRRVLVRLHPWQDDHSDEERLVRELAARGYEIGFALPQNRELVRDRARWRAAIESIAARFLPYGRRFQVGQAPNRSKWGAWTRGEYLALYLDAAEILRRTGPVELMGPAVIDFEFYATLALVNRPVEGLRYDIVSSLLYVDRRGAPENRQLGLDTVDMFVLLRATAVLGRFSSHRCWITEMNWPLSEGPHSPAGRSVSVDEDSQASFLVRYDLLTLGTGLVERVYWWQLVARGYGLMVAGIDGSLAARPSYHALRELNRRLDGAIFHGPLPAPAGAYLYRFTRGDEEVVVGWAIEGGVAAELPRPPLAAFERDGAPLPTPPDRQVTLGSSPVYFELGGERHA